VDDEPPSQQKDAGQDRKVRSISFNVMTNFKNIILGEIVSG